MPKSERIKSGAGRVGPGGMRCGCCGRSMSRATGRKIVRQIRRDSEALAISEGLEALEALEADALKAEEEEAAWLAQPIEGLEAA